MNVEDVNSMKINVKSDVMCVACCVCSLLLCVSGALCAIVGESAVKAIQLHQKMGHRM